MVRKRKRRPPHGTLKGKSVIIQPSKNLITPRPEITSQTPSLFLPLTQFEKRMAFLGRITPPPESHPLADIFKASAIRAGEIDLEFRDRLRTVWKRLPLWAQTRTWGGSGFQMANHLRSYFIEFLNRAVKLGIRSMPTSFNVVESFLRFHPYYLVFDILPETEHLLTADSYFDWYPKNNMPRDPAILLDVVPEDVVYSYNFAFDPSGYRLTTVDSTLVLGSVALVRHHDELSCLLIAGEKPPNPSDDEVRAKRIRLTKKKKGVAPDPDLGIEDRYLEEFPTFGRVILLTRILLKSKQYDVRYINIDHGNSYRVHTDDWEVLGDLPLTDDMRQHSLDGLARYESLFSALAALIYLPAYFAAEHTRVQEINVKTELYARQSEKKVVDAVRELGKKECCFERSIRCMQAIASGLDESEASIVPPELQFESEGYWKALGAGEIGEDKEGNRIIGRTWVTRHESWSASSPRSFLIKRRSNAPTGPDPGIIYVMRSPAHDQDVYKIGLTRHNEEERSRQLSVATGVPLPFGVLASWPVGNCEAVEKEVHSRLKARRISDRREFFHARLSEIISAVDQVIRDFDRRDSGPVLGTVKGTAT